MHGQDIPTTVGEAWSLLCDALRRLAGSADPRETAPYDARLAAFVQRNPGALESCFLTRTAELAVTAPIEAFPGLFTVLLSRTVPEVGEPGWPVDPAPLQRTIEALDPGRMLQWVAMARARHVPDDENLRRRLTTGFGCFFAFRAPEALDGAGFPLGVRECLRARVRSLPPPAVLPDDAHALSADAIEARLAEFADCSVSTLHRRLRPDGWSRSGFLAPADRLGDVIRRDALTLRRLGADRHALAARLRAVFLLEEHSHLVHYLATAEMDEAVRRGYQAKLAGVTTSVSDELGPPTSPAGWLDVPWRVQKRQYLGFQHDPFLPADVASGGEFASQDFTIERIDDPARLTCPGLVVQLIRRACFFEGDVRYRVDPERAAAILAIGGRRPGR